MIRRYQTRDLEQVVDLWLAASRLATPFLSETFLATERKQIRNVWMSQAESWVYLHEGDVLGFIALTGDEVGGIFVHPHSQGMGIGKALMDHASTQRRRLVLDVFEENQIGRRFYQRYGFRVIDRRIHEPTGHCQLRLEFTP